MSRRGYSLLEVVLAMTLFGLVTTVLVQVLVPGLRIFTLSQTLGEVETRSLAAHRRLVGELAATTEKSLYWLEEPGLASLSYLAVDRAGGYDPASGAPIWRTQCEWYLRQGRLCRHAWDPPTPPLGLVLPNTTPFALTPAQARLLASDGTPLCQGVTEFEVSRVAPRTYKVTLEVEALTQQERQLLRRESQVYVRN